jgi:hypothetical protein
MGCGCGGSNRQVVPRREQARQQATPVGRADHRLHGNGTVWDGPQRTVYEQPAPAPDSAPPADPVEA